MLLNDISLKISLQQELSYVSNILFVNIAVIRPEEHFTIVRETVKLLSLSFG